MKSDSEIIKRLTADFMQARQEAEELKKGQIELAVILARTPLFMSKILPNAKELRPSASS
jgi:hypothetical protein